MIWKLLIGQLPNLLPQVKSLAEVFVGNRAQRDANEHTEQIELQRTEAAAYSYKATSRTWFDGVIDGLNRLPRPFMAFGVIGVLAWPAFDRAGFRATMEAYSAVPDWLATLATTIVVFYFGSRTIAKDIPRQLGGAKPPNTPAGTAAPSEAKPRGAAEVAADWKGRAFGSN